MFKKIANFVTYHRRESAFGTFLEIELEGRKTNQELERVADQVFQAIQRVESLVVSEKDSCELDKINHSAHLQPLRISDELEEILKISLEISKLSDGFFDITILPKCKIKSHSLPLLEGNWTDIKLENHDIFFNKALTIDLGGIIKGYAVDKAIQCVDTDIHAAINIGGHLRMNHWRSKTVGLLSKMDDFVIANEVMMEDTAVATSACNLPENNSTIWNPYDRIQVESADSISVFAPNCILADALTKVVFLCPNASDILNHFKSLALKINRDGEVEFINRTERMTHNT